MRFNSLKGGFSCLNANKIIGLDLFLQDFASNVRPIRHHKMSNTKLGNGNLLVRME